MHLPRLWILAAAMLAAPAARAAGDAPSGWPAGLAPQPPLNFRVAAYARGLDGPRALLVLPNGDVLVAESRGGAPETRPSANRVTLLRDTTGNGVADKQFPLVDGLARPAGLALRRDRLYVADTDAVVSCPFLVGQTRLHGECHSLVDLPAAAGRDHWARALAFDADEARLYIGVGAQDDAPPGVTEPLRAAILVARPDGHELRVYASGTHAPGGLAVEPASGRLYATVSVHAPPGQPGPADYLTHLEDGASYAGARARTPDLAIGPGARPEGVAFYSRDHFPRGYRGGAFVALAGGDAPRVVFVPFADGHPAGAAEDFLTGFAAAPPAPPYGRPVAVAVATDGALLVADDAGGTIWRVTFKCAACTPDPVPRRGAKRAVAGGG